MALKSISKKLILDNAALEEEFFEDVKLTGIVCPLDSYHFIWKINQSFNFNFERNHSYEVNVGDLFFPVYSYIEEEKNIEHYIYSNRNKTHFLLPDMKNIDFVWLIKGIQYQTRYFDLINETMKKLAGIVYIFDINSDKLQQRQHLIL
jgi:hypothetical protein